MTFATLQTTHPTAFSANYVGHFHERQFRNRPFAALFSLTLLMPLLMAMPAFADLNAQTASAENAPEELTVTLTEIPVPAVHRELGLGEVDQSQNRYWTQTLKPAQIMPQAPRFSLSIFDVAGWVNIGKQIWDIVQSMAGKLTMQPMVGVGVVPAGSNAMQHLANWKIASPRSFELKIGGSFGDAFSLTYTVGYNYGGAYRGKGRFLANVAIVPLDAKCSWGWNCVVTANVGSGINVGTDDDPIAAIPINMVVNGQGSWNAKLSGVQFTVYGDGRLDQTVKNASL